MDCGKKCWPKMMNITLPHFQQQTNWDCGIACLLMVLGEKERQTLAKDFETISKEEGFHHSIWTVDLAYLLKRFQVSHRYCTITVGVDPTYSSVEFYERVLNEDETRINKKCQRAVTEGILEKSHQDMSNIIQWLSENNVAIVLVDARFLECTSCNPTTQFFRRILSLNTQSSYKGHYIVICGYNLATECIRYKNPSHTDGVCEMSFQAFETARTSHGTDEDIIYVRITG